MSESKPIKTTCGGFETDGNFNVQKFTKPQAIRKAKERLKRNRVFGCKTWSLIEKPGHWSISIQ